VKVAWRPDGIDFDRWVYAAGAGPGMCGSGLPRQDRIPRPKVAPGGEIRVMGVETMCEKV
jgi:hypothetical protein